ncbi:MAG TPA: GntR family transcriptional regulator [Candidatus Dormibacteraeota bacterium]|jgi:DNA-binding GntR family transcriptional regulator|nr:GntR family transcriptional regulator [Candidatus Dormibacteraeota bacterium]
MASVATRPATRPIPTAWSLPRFEGHSATETVRRIIRDAIVDGRIPAGDQLRESRLVEMLGTSRGTVREAIRHLVQEGLVEYRMHRGVFVKSPLLDDQLDVYVAREAIEVWAARELIERHDLLDLSALDDALAAMRSREARQKRPTEDTIAADLRFHHELVRLAGSDRLTRAHETFAAETRMLLRRHPPYPWRTYATDHQQLVDALRRRDPKTPMLVAEHLRLSRRLLGGGSADTIEVEPELSD